MALDEVVADVEQMLRTWQVQVTHPRYFGLFNPSVTLASVIADTLVAMYNPQLASWRTSPAGNEIERHTLGWLAAKFGLPADTHANFTSGGSEANLSAVIVALTRAFPGYGEDGLRCLDAIPAIYLTEEAHHSFSKIAHMTGLGRRALRTVATTSDLKMDLEDLRKRVAEDRKNGFAPFMVVGTAGTTAAGVIDPLRDWGVFAKMRTYGFTWMPRGAAQPLFHRLSGITSPESKLRIRSRATRINGSPFPWEAVCFSAAILTALPQTFRAEAAYMPGKAMGPAFDPYTTSVQWSRRFIGLKLFLALAQHGESGYAEMIESRPVWRTC